MSAVLTHRPLLPIFGEEIFGVDLSGELDEQVKRELRALFDERSLLLFRDQHLSEEDCDRATTIFGEIAAQQFGYVTNVPEHVQGRAEAEVNAAYRFHIDYSFTPAPLRGLMLYGCEIPPAGNGGETLFSDAQGAYGLLPPALRAKIDRLQVVHSTTVLKHTNIPAQSSTLPVAFPHPVTGRKGIFCSLRHFASFAGMNAEESVALREELAGYLVRPEIVYAHDWRQNDLLVWDNIRLMHGRNTFDSKHRRHLRRRQIAAPSVVPV